MAEPGHIDVTEAPSAAKGTKAGTSKALFSVLCILWLSTGTNFLGFKVAVEEIAPFTLTALRLGLAAVILLPAVLYYSKGWLKLGRSELIAVALTGTLFLAVGQGLTVVGIQGMPSGYAALLTASVPIFTVLIEWIWRGRRPGRLTFFGLALGAAGLAIVMVPSLGGTVAAVSIAMVLVGAFGWAFGTVWAQSLDLPDSALVTTFAQMAFAATVLTGIALFFEPAFQLQAISLRGWFAVAWIVLAGSIVGYGAFVYVRPRTSTSLANSFFYTGPVVALLLGAAFLSEPLGPQEVIGAGLAIAGVVLILRDQSRSDPTPPC